MSNPLYMRYCQMNINGRILTGPPMSMEFEESFSVNTSSQVKAKIYNPSPETVAACEKKKSFPLILIDAGYQSDFGTCVTGEIAKYELKEGADSILEMTIADKTSIWLYSIINKSWKGRIKASEIISQILKEAGITPAVIDLENDKEYTRGISFPGWYLRSILARMARDTKSQMFFRNGQVYFISPQKGHGRAITLSRDTGLLQCQKTNKGFKVRSLFLYMIGAGSYTKIESKNFTGTLKITKGKKVFSTESNAYCEFEGVAI